MDQEQFLKLLSVSSSVQLFPPGSETSRLAHKTIHEVRSQADRTTTSDIEITLPLSIFLPLYAPGHHEWFCHRGENQRRASHVKLVRRKRSIHIALPEAQLPKCL